MTNNLKALARSCFLPAGEGKASEFRIEPARASSEFLLALAREYFGASPSAMKTRVTLERLAQKAGVGSATQARRLLVEAEIRGLIGIRIQEDPRSDSEVIKEHHGLRDVIVCGEHDESDPLRDELGEMLAIHFDKLVSEKGHTRVSIGGGRTLHAMVRALQERERTISIAPLSFFSQDDLTSHARSPLMDAPFLAMALAWKAKCQPLICAIPPLPDQRRDCKTFTEKQFKLSPALKRAFDQACDADIILTSASQLDPASHLVKQYSLLGVTYDKLVEKGCVGHINYCPIDAEGNDLSSRLTPRHTNEYPKDCHPFLAAISVERIRATAAETGKNVVLAAGGPGKALMLQGLLKSRTINTLFTDSRTAAALRAGT